MNTDLVPTSRYGLQQLVEKSADPMASVDHAAEWFSKSGMFGCDRPAQGAILALTCLTEGISPIEFTRTYDIVGGKLRKKAAAAHAEFRRRGGKVAWTQLGDDGKAASATFTYDGQTVSLSFTIEQAKLAGLVKADSNWVKSPSNMLRARLLSNGIAILAPEIYAGENDEPDRPTGPTLQLEAPPAPAPAPAPVVTVAPAPAKPVAAPKAAAPVKASAPAEAPASAPVEVVDDVPMTYPTAPPMTQSVTTTAATTLEMGAVEPERPLLPIELQEQLITTIGAARLMKAVKYCQEKKMLGPDDTLDRLSPKDARRILMNIESFIQKVDAL